LEFVLIRYHAWWPSSNDPYYQYNIPENSSRINYYGSYYVPHLLIDGNIDGGANSGPWESLILTQMAVSSPIELSLSSNFDTLSREGNIAISIYAESQPTSTNLKLRIALIENDIYWPAPNGGQWHNQTFRDMIPNSSGHPIIINQGESLNLQFDYTCPQPLVYSNCDLVAFVQSDTDNSILQASKISIGENLGDCIYVVGDLNNSGAFNGLDIIYGVNFLKGGPEPPFQCECPIGNAWFVAGDVNGSCSFNGLDITYGVSFLKGNISELLFCPDCPPIG